VTLDKHDYFASPANIANSSTRSLPTTPRGSSRNISFSPRLQFHDVWSATDYDRRGDIATCNRLTPMLAQQIKEELNTFKMVWYQILDFHVLCLLTDILNRKWKFTKPRNLTHTFSDLTPVTPLWKTSLGIADSLARRNGVLRYGTWVTAVAWHNERQHVRNGREWNGGRVIQKWTTRESIGLHEIRRWIQELFNVLGSNNGTSF